MVVVVVVVCVCVWEGERESDLDVCGFTSSLFLDQTVSICTLQESVVLKHCKLEHCQFTKAPFFFLFFSTPLPPSPPCDLKHQRQLRRGPDACCR